MTLLLIRHGETALNAARTLQPADTPLSERGVSQALALARRVANMNVAGIVASDLPRAWRTAQAIAEVTGHDVEAMPLLQERNFGDWRGHPIDSFGFNPLARTDAPPNGESQQAFELRVAQAFAAIVQRRAAIGGTLVVVTHGLVLSEMLRAHAWLPAELSLPAHLGNTCISVLAADAPHAVTLLNCTLHLDALAADDAQALSGG